MTHGTDQRWRCLLLVILVAPGLTRGQGYSPDVAASKMTTAAGLSVSLFAAEPEVRQPIFVKCDDRGRVWTIQYLQYPNPAGLNRVKVDRWSRTVYDRVPEPPPHGPKGADRITICEDTNHDGRADKFTDFVDGLNLCTGLAFGHGGVFVLQVPYLLFYPDINRDDVPDSDPKVCLEGFGMEDAQALANHLTWGPDGWLYGVNGSTTTCRIRGVEFQQGCWRYHPVTEEFELFSEGGQNTFGLTFDEDGELFYSTNGGPFVHAAQGANFYKTFGKHGQLHHPYAYHFFPPLVVDQVPGGPPTGGAIYLGDGLSRDLRGMFIAGNFLGHTVSWWRILPKGATVEAAYGGVLLDAKDTWFGATDLCVGASGELYVSDFHDARTAHPDPDANWDRSNGRIYVIRGDVNPEPVRWTSLAEKSSNELVELLLDPHRGRAEQARMELSHRKDLNVVPSLRLLALQAEDPKGSLQGLWGLHGIGALDDEIKIELLNHPYPAVRRWVVRLAGDSKQASAALSEGLMELAESESDPTVRCQLAASARRWPAPLARELIRRLLDNSTEKEEERVDWMLWWGIEANAIADRQQLLEMFGSQEAWTRPAYAAQRLRLIRRYASEGTREGYDSATLLLRDLPETEKHDAFESLARGLAEREETIKEITQGDLFTQQASVSPKDEIAAKSATISPVEGTLASWLEGRLVTNADDVQLVEASLRANVPRSRDLLVARLGAENAPTMEWMELASLLPPNVRTKSLLSLRQTVDEKRGVIVIRLLSTSDDPSVGAALLERLQNVETPESVRAEIRQVLLGRGSWAKELLTLVDRGELPAVTIPVQDLRLVAAHHDAKLDDLVRRHWGNVGAGTPEEKLAIMRRFSNDLRAGKGDIDKGRPLFVKHCGTCHKMKGEGTGIAPDLTTANRHDRAALLANIVDPSSVIRREFMRYVVETESGQVIAGLVMDQDRASVTLVDERNQKTRIDRNEIASMKESNVSLMPERILENLSPQELRDLFAYLEQN